MTDEEMKKRKRNHKLLSFKGKNLAQRGRGEDVCVYVLRVHCGELEVARNTIQG